MPRDFVFVLDTSGSMAGVKMDQARKALKFCLSRLASQDRFAVINFATSVNRANNNGVPAVLESPSTKFAKSVAKLAFGVNGRASTH